MILSWEQLQVKNEIMISVQENFQDYYVVRLTSDLSTLECHYSTWPVLPLTRISNLLRFEDPALTSSQILHQ